MWRTIAAVEMMLAILSMTGPEWHLIGSNWQYTVEIRDMIGYLGFIIFGCAIIYDEMRIRGVY